MANSETVLAGSTSATNITLRNPDDGSLRVLKDSTEIFKVESGGIATFTNRLTLGTAASATGTSVDFTGIPSWVKRITVTLIAVSTNNTSPMVIQAGSGGVDTSGYVGVASWNSSTGTGAGQSITAGFPIVYSSVAATTYQGIVTLVLADAATNQWVSSSIVTGLTSAAAHLAAGFKAFAGAVDRIRITTVNGIDTFDAGTINILYE